MQTESQNDTNTWIAWAKTERGLLLDTAQKSKSYAELESIVKRLQGIVAQAEEQRNNASRTLRGGDARKLTEFLSITKDRLKPVLRQVEQLKPQEPFNELCTDAAQQLRALSNKPKAN